MPDDSAKRTALAKRMSSLLGLQSDQIEKLIPLVTADDLDRLEGMGDAEFLRESTKIINHAQRQQLDQMERIAEATTELSLATKPPAKSESSTPKLRPLRKPGEAPALRPSAPPPGLNETATAGVTIPQEAASRDMGGLRRVGDSGASVLPGAGASPAIDPLTGLPKEDPLARPAPAPAAAPAPAPAPLKRAKGDEAAFTPSSHSTARAEDLDPANDGGDAPKVMAPAEKPPIRAEGEETAESKIPEAFGTRTRTKIPVSAKKKKNMLIIGGLGAVLGLVLLVLLGLIVYQIIKPEPTSDGPLAEDSPPPDEKPPVEAVVAAPVTDTSVPEVPVIVSALHQDCLVITGEMNLELDRPGMMTNATSFTLEMWVKIRDPIKVERLTIDTGGETPAIKMNLLQGALSGLQFRASLAEARQNLVAPPPVTGAWTHLAVIYQGGDAPYLKAYTNGELAAEVALLDTPQLTIGQIRLNAEVMSRSGVIMVDELRLSSDVVYTANFKPERGLSGDRPGTVLYVPMERGIGDGQFYDTIGKVGIPLTGGAWVSLEKDAASPATKPLVELKLPQATLDAYAAERGERARAELLERWERLTDEQKRKYLEDNGLL